MARKAKSLVKLKSEINAAYPGRPTGSDGWIGDKDHSARTSDHNPNYKGVVCAEDYTEWVQNGVEMNDVVAEKLRASRDPRIKYVISDGRMFSSYGNKTRKAWAWGPYNGPNKHTKHIHVSVWNDYDNTAPWGIGVSPTKEENEEDMETIGPGSPGNVVKLLQKCLNSEARVNGRRQPHGPLDVDGDYGQKTKDDVDHYRRLRGIYSTKPGLAGGVTLALVLRYENR